MSSALKLANDDWQALIQEVCQDIGTLTGNVLSDKQWPMVESRLRRRLGELKLSTPHEYRIYRTEHQREENKTLIGLLTTHFTSFFREFGQFEWLASELPAIVEKAKKDRRSQLKFWSSACSKGQEVWSLCMWLQHHLPQLDSSMDWLVVGTDIDAGSVKEAENAVYHRRELETVPRHLWENYWVRGKGDISDWYKIKADLRKHAKFGPDNLLSLSMSPNENFDVIFCRNVLIYFDRPNQEKAVNGLLKRLNPRGTLITGVSESLSSHGLNLRSVAPSIYKFQTDVDPVVKPQVGPKTVSIPSPMRVLSVDDSPTVLAIIKKLLKGNDFTVVGTASNGQEAMEKVADLRPDIITLDLHMPIMDGPTFLKTSGVAKTIPVVVMSSVGRDDDSIVGPLFELGVCDFVEKPTMENMEKAGEELAQKLKMSWTAKKKNIQTTTAKPLVSKKRPQGHVVLNFGFSDISKVSSVIRSQSWDKDELTFYYDGGTSSLEDLKKSLTVNLEKAKKVNWIQISDSLPASVLPCIWFHFSGGAKAVVTQKRHRGHTLVVEETSIGEAFKAAATDLSPATSFSYLADKYLAGK